MKWLVASDIHGSAYYCEKLLEAYKKEQAERLILLGDILYHGPRNDLPGQYSTKDVAAMLNAMKNEICGVRGNCDAEIDQVMLEFPMFADYMLLPLGRQTVFVTHGHLWNTEKMPPLRPGDVLLHGHTHVPVCEQAGQAYYLNPGSVSIPKGGSWHGYILLEDRTFIWKDLDGCEHMTFTLPE